MFTDKMIIISILSYVSLAILKFIWGLFYLKEITEKVQDEIGKSHPVLELVDLRVICLLAAVLWPVFVIKDLMKWVSGLRD